MGEPRADGGPTPEEGAELVALAVATVAARLRRAERIPAPDLDALAGALRPGVDGLLLIEGTRRSTFLPAVWEKLPDPYRFVAGLLAKGGWPGWSDEIRAFRYASVEFADRAPRQSLE